LQREKSGLTPKAFQKILDRDGGACYHCALDDETLVPNHRANRGHGGSKSANEVSNIITLCSAANFLLESDAEFAALARTYGWKLSRYEDPLVVPVFDYGTATWYRLDNLHHRFVDTSRN
jgi:hypothetical protein